MSDVARGDAEVARGMQGRSVADIQRRLGVEDDGYFGPVTEKAVRDFQTKSGAQVDGIVGPETWGRLTGTSDSVERGATGERRAPSEADRRRAPAGTVRAGQLAREDEARRASNPLPRNASERQKYDYYSNLVRQNGGTVNPNGATVVGLREAGRGSTRSYDDRFAVLTPDGRVREFDGATHPGQTRSMLSPDVTGDGVGDVGMLKPGNYRVTPNGRYKGSDSFHVKTTGGSGSVPGWRDTNHDGTYSGAERTASERRGDRLGGVLFHSGDRDSPRSIGCLTLDPETYSDFVRAVGGANARFNFSLVEVR